MMYVIYGGNTAYGESLEDGDVCVIGIFRNTRPMRKDIERRNSCEITMRLGLFRRRLGIATHVYPRDMRLIQRTHNNNRVTIRSRIHRVHH